MKIIDTHSHIYLEEFDQDRPEVMERAQAAGVEKIMLPAIDMKTLPRLLAMCKEYPQSCFPMLGLHPTELDENYAYTLSQMKDFLREGHPFLAIGEVGLDFYWDETFRKEQLAAFDTQIQWSLEYGLPLIIHARSAHCELVNTLYNYKDEPLCGIFHCFSGTPEERDELLDFPGFYLGIGGVLTYKKSTLPQVIENVPLDRIVVETDSPYLAPVPHRGKRNESAYVYDTVCALAKIKGVDAEQVALITTDNAERLFWGCDFNEKRPKHH